MSRPFITSSSNPRLKAIRRLRRAPRRNGDGLFIVDGYQQLACAFDAQARIRELYVAPELYLGESEAELAALAAQRGTRVLELSAAAFASIAGDTRPDGMVALVERWPMTLERVRLGPNPLLLVGEAIERPGNLGAIVRATCAAGADAVIACGFATHPFHADVVRGSVGTLFKVPVARVDTAGAVEWLRQRAIRIVVATPGADLPHWQSDLTRPSAIVVGNERVGVSDRWLDAADELVEIPMPGPADSLNVAVAAGVALFEAVRQRDPQTAQSPRCPKTVPIETSGPGPERGP
jgi:TrmH family RNA methyltransferase